MVVVENNRNNDVGFNMCECLTSGCRCDHCHDWCPLDPLGVIQISISGLGVIFCLGGSCSATSMSEIELNGRENLQKAAASIAAEAAKAL